MYLNTPTRRAHTVTTVQSTGVILTEAAAAKARTLPDQEGATDLALRIPVTPGDCVGLRYQLYFDGRSLDGDVIEAFGGVKLVVDRQPVPYLSGTTTDFTDTIEQQGFTTDNPNTTGSCACDNPLN